MPETGALFDAEFHRELAELAWLARRLRLAGGLGTHAGVRRGGRVEFVGHHRYAPGDEFRSIDWHACARTGRVFVKEFAVEEGVAFEALIDATGSMARGRPPKYDLARRVAAAVAGVVLEAGGTARAHWLADGASGSSPIYERLAGLPALLGWLERGPAPAGPGNLQRALAERVRGLRRGSVVLLISDLLEAALAPAHLAPLCRGGANVHLLHLLAREDEAPPAAERVLLCDVETGEARELALDDARRDAYRHAVFAFCEAWRAGCAAHGVAHLLALSERRTDAVVLELLERGRLLGAL